jgi:hypothetical protein
MNEQAGRVWTRFMLLRTGTSGRLSDCYTYIHSSEALGSMKCGEFYYLRNG